MTQIDSSAETRSSTPASRYSRWRKIAIVVVAVVGAFLVLGMGLPWVWVYTPHWFWMRSGIVFLWFMLGVCLIAAPATAVGVVWSSLAVARARRRRDRAGFLRASKWALLSFTCLGSLMLMEAVMSFVDHQSYRIPDPELKPSKAPESRGTRSAVATPGTRDRGRQQERGGDEETPAVEPAASRHDASAINLLVIGESSAVGVPYDPWVSVGQIIGWKLSSVFPDRTVNVELRARGGFCLEQAVSMLAHLDYKPTAIILFSGHNEFHARYGWSRDVAHYSEDRPESLLGLQDLAREISATTRVIFKNLDRFYGERPPPPGVHRELVDHPTATPREYRMLLDEFERRLEAFTTYCNRNGSLAIMIVPGSNDGSYQPSRSVLAGATPAPARREFAAAFRAARAAESVDRDQAISLYRRLVTAHPEFAESHYRLGRLLAAQGQWSEAAPEFVAARDLDALPVRCQSDYRALYHSVARRFGSLLVDAPAILAKLSPHGILDDYLYHDAHHMSLVGTIAVAADILAQLKARHAFGWPESTPVPQIELVECARHFEMNREKWVKVCQRSSGFYHRQAHACHDPAERLEMIERYDRAAKAIAAGQAIDDSMPRSLMPLVPVIEKTK